MKPLEKLLYNAMSYFHSLSSSPTSGRKVTTSLTDSTKNSQPSQTSGGEKVSS